MLFKDLGLDGNILKAIEEYGYTSPTAIQQKAIKPVLEGNDLIGLAQTGTGKTAAFMLPILSKIDAEKKVKVLVITPTRELALQILENTQAYTKYTKINSMAIYGGVKQQTQVSKLRKGSEVIIATPGRLLDLMNQGFLDFKSLDYLVLDEADNMLDMGFINDIKKVIAKIPATRQTLLFSATMPKDIKKLAQAILKNPIEVSVAPPATTATNIEQYVYMVDQNNKAKLLLNLLEDKKYQATLIFTKTKHGANKLYTILKDAKFKTAVIHGNKSQNYRQRALADFKSGKINTLVATDVAARGIDVSDIQYVYNYDLPNLPETYVHRIGRTGRAGASGITIGFCNYEEQAYLKDIEKLIKQKITIIDDHDYPLVNMTITKKDTGNKGNRSKNNTSNFSKAKPNNNSRGKSFDKGNNKNSPSKSSSSFFSKTKSTPRNATKKR